MNLMLSDFFGSRIRDAVVDRTKVEERDVDCMDKLTRIEVNVRDSQVGSFRTQYKWIPRTTVFVTQEQEA